MYTVPTAASEPVDSELNTIIDREELHRFFFFNLIFEHSFLTLIFFALHKGIQAYASFVVIIDILYLAERNNN